MQIVYFPYLTLTQRDEVSFGDIKVWDFSKKAEEYIPDPALREKIKLLLESNVMNNRPIKGIGVLTIGDCDFRELNQDEFKIANEVRLVLFLAFIARVNVNAQGANAGHYVATSENFTFVIQNFEATGDYISQRNGFIIKKLDGGYKIGELLFHAPPYVASPMQFNIDEDLILQLLKIKRTSKRLYEKIIRATDLLFESYFNDPYLSLNARLLLQVGSFEVLLDLPDSGQRRDLKAKIEKYTVKTGEETRKYFSERPGGRKVQEIAALKVVWADKFYTLRNHVIHGEKVNTREFMFLARQSHIDIAPMFFVLVVKELINEKLKLKRKYFLDDIKWEKTDDGYEKTEGFRYKDSSAVRRLAALRRRS